MTRAAALRLLTEEMALPGLAWGVASIGESVTLSPEEARSVSRAVPKRKAEFAAGRLAARRAMGRLGVSQAPVPADENRAPVWPDGLCGSISHEDGLAVAVLALAPAALGVDLANDEALEDALVPEICRPEERALVPRFQQGRFATRLFSAKEAVYKAQFPATRTVLGFHCLEVDLDRGWATFTDEVDVSAIPSDKRVPMPITQRLRDGLILSLSARFF